MFGTNAQDVSTISLKSWPGRDAKGDPAMWHEQTMPPLCRDGGRPEPIFAGRRVLVTDGAGFVGSHLADALVERGCTELVIVDDLTIGQVANLASAMESGRVRLAVAGLRDSLRLATLLRGIDTVFHLGLPGGEQRDGSSDQSGTTGMLEFLEQCARAEVRKVVVALPAMPSRMGSRSEAGVEADTGLGSLADGGAAESAWDVHLRSARRPRELPVTILRYSDAYGPRMSGHGGAAKVLMAWMDRIAAGLAPERPSAGGRALDLIHVEDIVRACLLAAVSPASRMTLEIGTGCQTSMGRLIDTLAQVMGRQEFRAAPEDAWPPEDGSRHAMTHPARDAIGFEASIPIIRGLEDLVTWWCIEHEPARP